jgi:hypothetical protein
MRTTRFLVLLFACTSLVVHPGCGGDRATRKHTDAASQARLEGIDDEEEILVSIRTGDPEATFPVGRELLRVEGALLGAVPRGELDELADVPGLTGISVWGSSTALDKAGPRLRTELLTAWVEAPREPIPLLVQLEEGAPDVREALEGCGAIPRTVAGEVVTIDADPEAVFCILQLAEVTRISAPRALRPSGN